MDDDNDDGYWEPGAGTVFCDEKCGALEVPIMDEDFKKAYFHWKGHASLHGCSHGY